MGRNLKAPIATICWATLLGGLRRKFFSRTGFPQTLSCIRGLGWTTVHFSWPQRSFAVCVLSPLHFRIKRKHLHGFVSNWGCPPTIGALLDFLGSPRKTQNHFTWKWFPRKPFLKKSPSQKKAFLKCHPPFKSLVYRTTPLSRPVWGALRCGQLDLSWESTFKKALPGGSDIPSPHKVKGTIPGSW